MQGTPWTQETTALKSFWSDAASAGLTAALRLFPYDDTCAPKDPQCTGNLYVTPLVDWGVLPANAAPLGVALDTAQVIGCTPTEEALKGALKGSLARQVLRPDHVVVAVVVSDGEPIDCDITPIGLSAVAASYLNGEPPIRTFTLYVAAAASAVMSAIAQGGGTNNAYDATNIPNFIAALKAIQVAAIPCEVAVPKPEAGVVDPNQVKLTYKGVPITHVDSMSQCGGTGGWYFDNNAAPTKILFCPSTCSTLKSDPSAKVELSLGCL
jgi:hypothetical protein